MQKLLIVEDEKSIFFLLNSCILYEELGLELAGYAENGQMAYDMIMEKRPDIVITDISMPIIDGLELIERVQKQHVNPKFIIVSGYAQFEFAKKAVKLGVRDYLLKPINSNELNKSLAQLAREISEDGNERTLLQSSDNHKEKIRTSFIMSILYRDVDFHGMTVQQINRDYFYSFQEGYFCSVVMKVDYYSDIVIGIRNHITDSLMIVIRECFSDICCEVSVAEHQENIYVILNLEESKQKTDEMRALCKRVLVRGKKLTEAYADTGITVCLGKTVSDVCELPDSFESALHLLDMRIVRGADRVLDIHESGYHGSAEGSKYVLPAPLLHGLVEKVECNELTEVRGNISAIFQDVLNFCKREDVSVYKTLRGVMLNVLSVVKQKGNFPNEFMDIYQELSTELNKCSRYCDIISFLPEKMTAGMLKFRKDEQSEGSLIMKRVLEYISQNYDKQLKLEEAAEQVYITPAYLGIIFKKETGKNFTAYLTDLRMEKAKELLLDVRININEITYKVGYHNVRYFSRTFKEYVGITPKEYRKIHANRKY